jgi:hypothetical protein
VIGDQAAMQLMSEINRNRVELLESNHPEATEHFLLCGVEVDALGR